MTSIYLLLQMLMNPRAMPERSCLVKLVRMTLFSKVILTPNSYARVDLDS